MPQKIKIFFVESVAEKTFAYFKIIPVIQAMYDLGGVHTWVGIWKQKVLYFIELILDQYLLTNK